MEEKSVNGWEVSVHEEEEVRRRNGRGKDKERRRNGGGKRTDWRGRGR